MITAVLVDDEPLAIEGLRLRLENISDIQIVGEGFDGDDAIRLCHEHQPDVLFIDLRLPGLSGLEVVQGLQSDTMPLVVFVSAYSDYAIEAFELNALDYLMKPVNLGRLKKTVDRIRHSLADSKHTQKSEEKAKLLKALGESSGLSISQLQEWLDKESAPFPEKPRHELLIKNHDNEQVFLCVDEIMWVDAAGDYMCIHTDKENYIVRITLKRLSEELDNGTFARIHKSTLVNVNFVKSFTTLKNNESMLDLGGDIRLKVSRNYSDTLKSLLKSRVGDAFL
ncbi:LytR/AlgR family response regulator transcription factor [Pseudoalteromonas luteoviolacea]|uniref:LytR/AlgR family response regulator transcription factor n=1 Tax=Pseudoalteromonas luteoviolacea TaxID=43657 RepID=UPI0011543A5A|nr:LytTR family DNA-binding domain-containing protein [Pseudoalteromonas luteoviolacea]TQF70657.1 response regulator transcription factor [Pseudoalteromonas luteoviolacea]